MQQMPIKYTVSELSKEFTKFAENYFNDYAKMTDCENNDIELPAEIRNLPDLCQEYETAMKAGGQDKLYYFNANHLGSGSLITDGDVQTYQTLAYAPYGEDLVNIRQAGNYEELRKFTGQLFDEESGLYYFNDRYVNTNYSINYSPDRHGDRYPHQSSYVYSNNNPIMYNDPTGMDGEVTGEGTKDNPYVIHAAYYYQNGALSDAEVQGLNDAATAYNNAGTQKIKSNYVRYNIEVQGVDDVNVARGKTAFIDANGNEQLWGNEVGYSGSENADAYGSGNRNGVYFNPKKIENGIAEGRDAEKFHKGIMIHEIGHNLGGDHSVYNDNSVMDERGDLNGFFIYPQIDRTFKSFTKEIFNPRDTPRPVSDGVSLGRLWTRGR